MKFRNSGQVLLACFVSLLLCFGLTSCSNDYTVGYLYVTSAQYNQVQGFRIDNNRGQLRSVTGPIKSSGGTNPVRMLVPGAGRFLYVLNTGCGAAGQAICSSSSSAVAAGNITLFSIGGFGQVTQQQSFASQGINPIRMQTDASGKFLYVLDKIAPDGSGNGDITVFSIDPNTGRLTLVTNSQILDQNGTNLTYFPVGRAPVDMIFESGYVFVVDSADQTIFPYAQNPSTGQLTVSQNGPQPTGAVNISVIGRGGTYIYLLDAGTLPSSILPYTIGGGGALQAVVGGTVPNYSTVPNPTSLLYLTVSGHNYLYITNAGPNTGTTTPNGDISAYSIQSNGTLTPVTAPTGTDFSTGSGPACLAVDPTNQYLYSANFNDGSVTGRAINSSNGELGPLHGSVSNAYTTANQPTYCISTGT